MALGLTREERTKLVEKMEGVMADQGVVDWDLRVRECVMLLLGLEAGLRTSEVLKVRISDVWFMGDVRPWLDLPANFNKRCKAGQVFFSRRITAAVRLYMPIRKSWLGSGADDGPLIVSKPTREGRGNGLSKVHLWAITHAWAARAGVRDFRFHDLRHTFATFAMAADNSNLRVVQDLLRHRTLTATQVYLHPTFDEMRKVIEGAFNGPTDGSEGPVAA